MEKVEFIPVDFEAFDFEGKNYIRLIGRTNKGKKICVVDTYEPNFYIILQEGHEKDAAKISKKISSLKIEKSGRASKVENIEVLDKNFLGKKVKALRIFVTNHKDAHELVTKIGEMKGIETRKEYDINLVTKYIKEKKVEPLVWHEVKGDILGDQDFGGLVDSLEVDVCIGAQEITKSKVQKKFEPKILAYDIETDGVEIGKGSIFMISLYGDGFKKVLTWKSVKGSQKYVESFKDESDMIEAFVSYVKEYDPDILTGYFSDGFDLPYIYANAKKAKVALLLGLDGREPSFSRGRIPSGKIAGIVHVDLFRFIDCVFSQYLQSESLSLNDVASELIGESKEDFDFRKLKHMKDSDWLQFFSYNLQDAAVTYKLAQKIWPDMFEFSSIVKEPLFNVTRDRMATHVENYVIHRIDEFNEIVEKRPLSYDMGERRRMGAFEGAFVKEPEPGLYEDLVMFDFTSMYPSVIVSYNLSKSTHIEKEKFSKKKGFFPTLLEDIIEKRKKHKKEYAKDPSGMLKARSNAYKLLANASYGYQAFFGARYYSREAAAATATLARKHIKETISTIEKKGYTVVYGDTDSIAFLQEKKTKKQILSFLHELNENLPGIMELDLEDFYPRGIFVNKRDDTSGAKKKYALINNKGVIKIRGFETVRRDWCPLARKLQSDILKGILEEGNEKRALEILKKTVKDLQLRAVEVGMLLIKTKLKRPISEYITEGPHVAAARKMKEKGLSVGTGTMIRYFVGTGNGKKSQRIKDRVFLEDELGIVEYDIDYYLNNQVIPAVQNIFNIFGVSIEEIIDGHEQKKLF